MYDVIVVGAGQAGARAMAELAMRGLSVCLVEARARAGGRTSTEYAPDGMLLDVGGQWIGSVQKYAWEAVQEFGLHVLPQYDEGKNVLDLCGQVSVYSGNISEVALFGRPPELESVTRLLDQLSSEIAVDAPHLTRHVQEWDRQTFEQWIHTNIKGESARNFIRWFSRVCLAAEPYEASLLFFLWWLRSGGGYAPLVNIHGGAQEATLLEGTQAIAEKYIEKALKLRASDARKPPNRVLFSAPVSSVSQSTCPESGLPIVDVETVQHERLRARYVIVAVPPTLCPRIRFSPPLPAAREQLCMRMPMGCVIKCIIRFARPFWRELGFSGEMVSDSGPLCICYDKYFPEHNICAIAGLICGAQARQWAQRPVAERQEAVLRQLARCFGTEEAMKCTQFVEKDWTQEEFSRGCYMNVFAPGAMQDFAAALRQPVGQVHWAGTETADVWIGYIDGALQSGVRAAEEVARRLEQDAGRVARL